MSAGAKKSRKRLYIAAAAALALVGGAIGFVTVKGASTEVGASRLATVPRGTMVKSVVATGKVEPITNIDIKSKANGIIKILVSGLLPALKASRLDPIEARRYE